MTTKEKIIKGYTPEGLAIQARRGPIWTLHGSLPAPVKWTEKRIGGGFEITSAEWDWDKLTEEEIEWLWKGLECTRKIMLKWKDKSLFEICEMFSGDAQ